MHKLIAPILFLLLPNAATAELYEEDDLPYVEIVTVKDFNALTRQARENEQIIMLEMSARYCGYCETLEEEIIKPMLRSGDYEEKFLIRKLEIDAHYPISGIGGERTSPSDLAKRYDVFVTPTLLFIDSNGRELSERILGINSLDFYGAYVDEALFEAHRKLTSKQ